MLSNILSDKQIIVKHATIENLLLIKLNDKVRNDAQCKETIKRSLKSISRNGTKGKSTKLNKELKCHAWKLKT